MLNNGDFMPQMIGYVSKSEINYQNGPKSFLNFGTVWIVKLTCDVYTNDRSTDFVDFISQLIRFARVSSQVVDFNARNKSLTAKLLGIGIINFERLSPNFIADTINWFLNSVLD